MDWAISSAHLPVCTATTSCTEQSVEQCQSLQYVDPDCPIPTPMECNGMDYPCVILQSPDGMTQTCQPAGTQPDPSDPTQMMEVCDLDAQPDQSSGYTPLSECGGCNCPQCGSNDAQQCMCNYPTTAEPWGHQCVILAPGPCTTYAEQEGSVRRWRSGHFARAFPASAATFHSDNNGLELNSMTLLPSYRHRLGRRPERPNHRSDQTRWPEEAIRTFRCTWLLRLPGGL